MAIFEQSLTQGFTDPGASGTAVAPPGLGLAGTVPEAAPVQAAPSQVSEEEPSALRQFGQDFASLYFTGKTVKQQKMEAIRHMRDQGIRTLGVIVDLVNAGQLEPANTLTQTDIVQDIFPGFGVITQGKQAGSYKGPITDRTRAYLKKIGAPGEVVDALPNGAMVSYDSKTNAFEELDENEKQSVEETLAREIERRTRRNPDDPIIPQLQAALEQKGTAGLEALEERRQVARENLELRRKELAVQMAKVPLTGILGQINAQELGETVPERVRAFQKIVNDALKQSEGKGRGDLAAVSDALEKAKTQTITASELVKSFIAGGMTEEAANRLVDTLLSQGQ